MKNTLKTLTAIIIKDPNGHIVDRVNIKAIEMQENKTTGNLLIVTEKAE